MPNLLIIKQNMREFLPNQLQKEQQNLVVKVLRKIIIQATILNNIRKEQKRL